MSNPKFLIPAAVLILLMIGSYFYFFLDSEKKVFVGNWTAKWRTPSESFAGIDAFTAFEMDGIFIFTPDSVTVVAKGYPGCVFGVDTSSHTQEWSVSAQRDSLNLISEGGLIGISYKINGLSDQVVELQLLEDIFISLEKVED